MPKSNSEQLLQSESVAEFLKKEFVRRLDGNPRYSLRAFARDLELSPSRLSESMNQKSGVSLATVEKISVRLKLSKSERAIIRNLYLLQGKKNRGARDLAKKNMHIARERSKVKRLDSEKFKVIAEWYHAAILQMTELKHFVPDSHWISTALQVSPERTRLAIERLMKLGLLANEGGRWVQSPELMVTESDIPNTAIRRYHKDMMRKAFRAIDETSIDRRFIQSMTLAIPSDRYRDVCEKIQTLLKEAWELSESSDNGLFEKDKLYSINIQFFPLISEEKR